MVTLKGNLLDEEDDTDSETDDDDDEVLGLAATEGKKLAKDHMVKIGNPFWVAWARTITFTIVFWGVMTWCLNHIFRLHNVSPFGLQESASGALIRGAAEKDVFRNVVTINPHKYTDRWLDLDLRSVLR